jgi:hypothetical protein
MKFKKLLLTVCLSCAAAAFAQGEDSNPPKKWKFDVQNVSLGMGLREPGVPDPANFTFGEFTDHVGQFFDLGMSANVYGKWNLRTHIGYLGKDIKPEDYFDRVMPWSEVDGVYDDINGHTEAWCVNGIIPESNIYINLGISRSFTLSKCTITPFYSMWLTNERGRIIVDGYQEIATGTIIDETALIYDDFGLSAIPYLGIDVELDKFLLGFGLGDGTSPMPYTYVRLGYKL